jgi:TonB family protein
MKKLFSLLLFSLLSWAVFANRTNNSLFNTNSIVANIAGYESQSSGGGMTTYYRNQDRDSFGNPSVTQTISSAPLGYVANIADSTASDNPVFSKVTTANPDVYANPPLNETWLSSISRLLMAYIAYPARGRAYHITGKMYVTININPHGKLKAVAFEKSLGNDFEQAIMEAIDKIPRSKIKPLALPLAQQLRFVLPVYFKE